LFGIAALVFSLVGAPVARASDPPHDARLAKLCDLLAHDTSFKVRASAAQRLGNLTLGSADDERAAARALIEALSDRNEIVRGVAAHAIGQRNVKDARVWLVQLRDHDDNDFVRQSANAAIKTLAGEIAPAPKISRKKPQKVELGRVNVAHGSPGILDAIKDAIDDLIEPHRPALWPREDADVRIDVTIVRSEDSSSREHNIRYEARVILVQLPGANLRHASNATATVRARGANAVQQLKALEKEVALKATTRAVSEALAMLDKG
jgi:HEAT repeat protein